MNEAHRKAWLATHSQELLERLGICEGCTVLDFGCGGGTYAIPAARLVGDKGKVYALDKDAAALAKVRKTAQAQGLQNIETILSSNLETGMENGCVEVVLLHDVLHMIDQRATLFRAVRQVLCPGGRISVHPMHVNKDELTRQMEASRLRLLAQFYESNILVFGRAEPEPETETA